MSKLLYIIFATIITCIIFYLAVMIYFNGNKKEAFSQYNNHLTSGDYPLAVDKPILYGDYNVKTPPSLSALNASDIYKDYPVFPATSLENNRIRYWSKPENGTCSRAELCGYFYDDYTEQKIPAPLTPPGWNKRVNFYVEDY
jgi:hypothetical protein